MFLNIFVWQDSQDPNPEEASHSLPGAQVSIWIWSNWYELIVFTLWPLWFHQRVQLRCRVVKVVMMRMEWFFPRRRTSFANVNGLICIYTCSSLPGSTSSSIWCGWWANHSGCTGQQSVDVFIWLWVWSHTISKRQSCHAGGSYPWGQGGNEGTMCMLKLFFS